MFDKFEQRFRRNRKSGYAWYDYCERCHYNRFQHYVEAHGLLCQECGGAGQLYEETIADHAIYIECGWCLGTGRVPRHLRGAWLRWKREEKRENNKTRAAGREPIAQAAIGRERRKSRPTSRSHNEAGSVPHGAT